VETGASARCFSLVPNQGALLWEGDTKYQFPVTKQLPHDGSVSNEHILHASLQRRCRDGLGDARLPDDSESLAQPRSRTDSGGRG